MGDRRHSRDDGEDLLSRSVRGRDDMRSRVRDASRELTNIERQRNISASALRELELQTEVLSTSVEEITNQRSQTETRMIQKEAAMSQRLRAIYKRGPLNDMRVLLGAESFGELLSRYKYLKQITMYEQRLVEEVSRLENALTEQEKELRENLKWAVVGLLKRSWRRVSESERR